MSNFQRYGRYMCSERLSVCGECLAFNNEKCMEIGYGDCPEGQDQLDPESITDLPSALVSGGYR